MSETTMTDKKASILEAALELFATDGYNATPTSRIAKKAGVSEGLIFRHFENKQGLLQAIMQEAKRRLGQVMAMMLFEDDPKEVLRHMIALPFAMPKEEYDFWKLQFKLKWQAEYNQPDKIKPVLEKLEWAFNALGYDNPRYEAIWLNLIMEGIAVAILRDGVVPDDDLKNFIYNKYQL